ncbi:MAG: ribonuclease HII [Pseudomonadota bacterium]|nr:ribonuclease HII [Pseudomonadota bacterium]MEC8470460.1 ribonuclease HII [Pseudomonadota bacterium]
MKLHGNCLVAGVDEVGRGCLAGDVLAAAVILQPKKPIHGLTDSKAIKPYQRSFVYKEIIQSCVCYSIGRASVYEIDRFNILQATLLAMKRAVDSLQIKPHKVMVDGNALPKWEYESEAIIKGDSKVPEISAASIIAKVTRDEEMNVLAKKYPGYGFSKNKGYGTPQHKAAIKAKGFCDCHRKTFSPMSELINNRQECLL